MNLRFYIPISQHLNSDDIQMMNIKGKEKFYFQISCPNSASVLFSSYKSLACFLSGKAYLLIKRKHNSLKITYQSNQLTPMEVVNRLLGLLSGEPILIDQNNFQVFEEVFNQLGNRDFDLYFNHKMPEEPTEFYLSIHSLKLPRKKFLESKFEHFFHIKKSIISIPKGIFHLFFSDEINKFDYSLIDSLTGDQIQEWIDFLTKFSKGHFSIPTLDQIYFLSIFRFHKDILNSYYAFFFPLEILINIPHKEFEEYQLQIDQLENQK
jgi:hypothetical protein